MCCCYLGLLITSYQYSSAIKYNYIVNIVKWMVCLKHLSFAHAKANVLACCLLLLLLVMLLRISCCASAAAKPLHKIPHASSPEPRMMLSASHNTAINGTIMTAQLIALVMMSPPW